MTEGTQSSSTEPTSSTQQSTVAPDLDARVRLLTDRRGVLKAAGVVGVAVGAGALAACSSPPVPSNSGAAAAQGGAGTAGASGATGSTGSTGSAPASGGGTPTSDVPVGGGTVFPDTQTVVTQPTAGTFKAFSAICPHQGCTVGSVEGGQIICPCHQSHFDAATGDRVSGPAPSGLTPKNITVTGSTFTVS